MNENKYCIRVVAGRSKTPGCNWTYASSPVTLSRNGIAVGTLANGFSQKDFCLDGVDSKNDIFKMTVTGSDGVSFL